MIGFMDGSSDALIGLTASGEIDVDDFTALAGLLRESVEKSGEIDVVLELDALDPAVSPGVLWQQVKLAADTLASIRRLAIVGDALWHEAYVKIVGPLIPADVKHFAVGDLDAAWDWARG